MDWAAGRYERIAGDLRPAAEVVIARANPTVGAHLLDIGCGTGNAALMAAGLGARVTGVDPAERLLDVAREEAGAHCLSATFLRGEAGALPVPDGTVDVAASVFGVIFAPDPVVAASEMARVVKPHGRIVISAWLPVGALSAVMDIRREAIAAATGSPPGPPAFPWHDRDALDGLLAPHGFTTGLHEHAIAFSAISPQHFLDAELSDHPMWLATRDVLDPGGMHEVRERALRVLTQTNEDAAHFRITSGYVVAVAQRSG